MSLVIKYKKPGITEQELVQRCVQEDAVAQRVLFDTYGPGLQGICYRYAKDESEASEIFQLGFIKIFDKLGEFRFESGLKTWMTRIVINTALNYLKANERVKWETDIETQVENATLTVEQMHGIDLGFLMNCIQQLPAGYRIVLNMYAIEGYSHREIAEELNITESTSRSQFARAKNVLEKKLSVLGFDKNNYAGKRI